MRLAHAAQVMPVIGRSIRSPGPSGLEWSCRGEAVASVTRADAGDSGRTSDQSAEPALADSYFAGFASNVALHFAEQK